MLLIDTQHVDAVTRIEVELESFQQAKSDHTLTAIQIINKMTMRPSPITVWIALSKKSRKRSEDRVVLRRSDS